MDPMVAGMIAVHNGDGTGYFQHADWLGSSRLAVTGGGTVPYDRAYAPFGEIYDETASTNRNFTGQREDTTPGIYDFLFRQQSQSQGRWLTPDPAGLAAVDITNPQTWNRYVYVANNPLSNVDWMGLYCAINADGGTLRGCGQGSIASFFFQLWQNSIGSESYTVSGGSTTTTIYYEGQPISTSTTYSPGVTYNIPVSFGDIVSGLVSGGSGGTSPGKLYQLLKKSPIPVTVSVYAPFVYGVAGLQFNFVIGAGQVCGGLAGMATTPSGRAISAGPLVHGNLANAANIIQGFGASGSVQLSPLIGYQATWNSSGALGGPTVSNSMGASFSAGYNWCGQ